MELGMIGLGRMGANMVRRLVKHGHTVVGNARHRESVDAVVADGMIGAYSLEELTDKLHTPRAVWLMLPAASVDSTIESLVPLLARDDIIVDGGNSYYHDDIRRGQRLASAGIHYVDVGTIPRTPGREGPPSTAEYGYLHCGPSGAGHFVKMVHNGVEYGLMAAYAEGLNILRRANVGMAQQAVDAETTPLRDPELYQYDLNLGEVAEVWRRARVVASWLLDLTAAALVHQLLSAMRYQFGGHRELEKTAACNGGG